MFTKFLTSWRLFKQSVSVVNQHRKLLLFPILTSVMTLGIFLFFLAPVLLQPTGFSYTSGGHWKAVAGSIITPESMTELQKASLPGQPRPQRSQVHLSHKAGLYVLIIYFVSMFFAAFFNVAFCHEIFSALQGQDISIRSGLAFAASRWKPILWWSLFSGLIGLIIQKLEERFGFIGRWVISLIGMAWSIACVFAIPVLVNEAATISPLDVLKTSASRLKKTWGESLAGYVGMGAGSMAFMLLSLVVLVGFVALSIMQQNPIYLAVGFLIWFSSLVLFSYLWSVAGLVFKCALYLYSTTSTPPAPYTIDSMGAAWKTR